MRIFTGLNEAYNEIKRDLVEMGTIVHPESYQDKIVKDDPAFETKELQGYCYSITNLTELQKDFKDLKGDLGYLQKEYLDRVNPSYLNPGNSWETRKEVWEPFLHGGKFAYSYNERIRTQLPIILEQLKDNPNTRQAVITIYDHHQDIGHLGGKARIPCSMYYQILLRKRRDNLEVDILYTMRSCDLFTHFIYDVALTVELQHFIAGSLGLNPGHFTHFIGSLHAYKIDYSRKEVF